MRIGVIADDFTGASDIANTLAKGLAPEGGLHTAQFAGVPREKAPPGIAAGVVSLKTRTAPVDKAVAQSLHALEWLRGEGCTQIVFKYCSTFDSTERGNIGPVAEALAQKLDARGVLVCPAFPATGRTIYQGHLFVADKLLSECGMETHPLTPMTDPDIRRWLQRQTNESVGHVPHPIVSKSTAAIRNALAAANDRFIVADAVSDGDLLRLGEAVADAPLITGGSGIALALPRNILRSGAAAARAPGFPRIVGPAAILAGSCSGATRAQVDEHARAHPSLAIDVPEVMDGRLTSEALVTFFKAHAARDPLAYSSSSPDEVGALQKTFGQDAVAEALETLFAKTASRLIDEGFHRIVVAGGETSGAVAQSVCKRLGVSAMTIGPEIDPGVPVLLAGHKPPIALALKSGNFGALDVFAKALQVMEKGGS